MDFYIVLIVAVAVCYGWGMRGCIIGGEKGALLPGALLGFTLALTTHNGVALAFAAVGAIGMFRGGTEPYAQTLDGIRKKYRTENRLRIGIIGTFIKGALWFGIAAVTLAMFTGAATIYKEWSLYLLLLIPVVQALGVQLFNKPFYRENGRFPKLYFSRTSREEWGGSVLHFLLLCLIAAINKDIFSIIIGGAGFVGGGIGFVAGILLDDFCSNPLKSGRYLFGKLYLNGRIDAWKIMEHSFGFIAGFVVALAFFFQQNEFFSRLELLSADNTSSIPFFSTDAIGLILFALILLSSVQYPLRSIIEKKTGKSPDNHIFELLERPLYEAFPLFLICCGNTFLKEYYAAFILLYVLGEEFFGELYERYNNQLLIKIIGVAIAISGLVPVFTGNPSFVILPFILAVCAYTLMCILHLLPTAAPRSRTTPTLLTHFFLETIFIVVISVLIF